MVVLNLDMVFKLTGFNLAKQTSLWMLWQCLKFLEELISEYLQMDDSALEETTPIRIHLLNFKTSKQLFSKPQLVHLTAIEYLTLSSFLFREMTKETIIRFLQNRSS